MEQLELPWLRLPEPGGSWPWPGPGSTSAALLSSQTGAEPTQHPHGSTGVVLVVLVPFIPAALPLSLDVSPPCPRSSENTPELRDFT